MIAHAASKQNSAYQADALIGSDIDAISQDPSAQVDAALHHL